MLEVRTNCVLTLGMSFGLTLGCVLSTSLVRCDSLFVGLEAVDPPQLDVVYLLVVVVVGAELVVGHGGGRGWPRSQGGRSSPRMDLHGRK